MAQVTSSQLGPDAIAHPAGQTNLPSSAPHLHHLGDDSKHANETDDLQFTDIPPFPSDIPTAPLLRINLQKLIDQDREELANLWRACCDLGFFYLDLRGAVSSNQNKRDSAQDLPHEAEGTINGDGLIKDAAALFKLGERLFELPTEEKQSYDFKDQGSYYGYKGLGSGVVDAKGTRDRNEFYNVSKDDILGTTEPIPAPDLLKESENRHLLKSYITRSHAIVTLVLQHLNSKLGLPSDTLQNLHRLRAVSGDQVRWVSAPPQPQNDRQKALGEHTDFGSVTVLFNRLGGLQVLPPNQEQWCYVKPLKGHCVVNLGDAMVKFTAGILRSNIHRVVSPPGKQADFTRMSLVYFARPEDDVTLRVLVGSETIDARRRETGGKGGEEEEISAKEWILRRAMGRRAGGDWDKSAGTEGDRINKT